MWAMAGAGHGSLSCTAFSPAFNRHGTANSGYYDHNTDSARWHSIRAAETVGPARLLALRFRPKLAKQLRQAHVRRKLYRIHATSALPLVNPAIESYTLSLNTKSV